MRQGQQNRRGRGRSNRKSQNHHHNPLMRTYQSNGPDQKIHGTPAQIAEKYMSLARDALSSGDPVLAENYLQHAEHYNRIILTYREQQMQQGGEGANGPQRRQQQGQQDNFDGDFSDEDGDDNQADYGSLPTRLDQPRASEPQPRGFDQPQARGDDRQQRQQGESSRDNSNREGNRNYRQRGFSQDRGGNDRGDRGDRQGRQMRDRQGRGDRQESFGNEPKVERGNDRTNVDDAGDVKAASPSNTPRRGERFADAEHEQPEFLRRPVRRTRKPAATREKAETATADDSAADS